MKLNPFGSQCSKLLYYSNLQFEKKILVFYKKRLVTRIKSSLLLEIILYDKWTLQQIKV